MVFLELLPLLTFVATFLLTLRFDELRLEGALFFPFPFVELRDTFFADVGVFERVLRLRLGVFLPPLPLAFFCGDAAELRFALSAAFAFLLPLLACSSAKFSMVVLIK